MLYMHICICILLTAYPFDGRWGQRPARPKPRAKPKSTTDSGVSPCRFSGATGVPR